jgi:hypothetical protein
MAITKRAVFTAWLSATPCTPEMRERVIAIASERNLSVAELQRQAISLFLSSADRVPVIENREAEPA